MSILNTITEKPRPYFESLGKSHTIPFDLRWVRERWKSLTALGAASAVGSIAIATGVDVNQIGRSLIDGASTVNYFVNDMQELPLEPKLFFGSLIVGIPVLLTTVAVQLRRN